MNRGNITLSKWVLGNSEQKAKDQARIDLELLGLQTTKFSSLQQSGDFMQSIPKIPSPVPIFRFLMLADFDLLKEEQIQKAKDEGWVEYPDKIQSQ